MIQLRNTKNSPGARGFTIVELLIVIVVIAILATISVVAYSGIQERAQNSAVEQAASQALKLLTAYTSTKGGNPVGAGCLVPVAGSSSCLWGSSSSVANATVSANIASIGTLASSVPAFTETQYAGVFYSYDSARQVGGAAAPAILVYTLRGHTNCAVGRIVTGGGVVSQPSTLGYTLRTSSGNTLCIASVPSS